jgi:hypothetical protein
VTITGGTLVRVMTLVSGVLAIVLSNLATFHLPASVTVVLSAVGGTLLAVLAYLEHPTTVTAASTPTTAVTVAPGPATPTPAPAVTV